MKKYENLWKLTNEIDVKAILKVKKHSKSSMLRSGKENRRPDSIPIIDCALLDGQPFLI